MARPEKEAMVAELTEKLTATKAVFLTDFTGLDVEAMNQLRRQCRSMAAEYRVVKNTLTRFAAENAGFPELKEHLKGPTGLVLVDDDPTPVAKIIVDFGKEHDKLCIKVGLLEGKLISADEVRTAASLPSREVLIGQVLGGLNAPITGIVGVLGGLLVKLVRTIDAVAQKGE